MRTVLKAVLPSGPSEDSVIKEALQVLAPGFGASERSQKHWFWNLFNLTGQKK